MGKSSSKPKKRKESLNNLSWSRFGSLPLRSKTRISKSNKLDISSPEGNNNPKHIDVVKWLKSMDLEKYEDNFRKFEGVEDLLEFSEADLKDFGVKISSHRAMMISNLTLLRAKYHGDFRRQPSVRHSVAVDKKVPAEDSISTLSTVYEPIQTKSLNNLIMVSTFLINTDPNIVSSYLIAMNNPRDYASTNALSKQDAKMYLDLLKDEIHWNEAETILDVGCGDGSVTLEVLLPEIPENYQQLIAMDISKEMIEYSNARQKSSKIEFIQYNVAHVPISGIYRERFDHIFSFYCLQMIENQRAVFSNLYQMLKPSGQLFVTLIASSPQIDAHLALSKTLKWASLLSNFVPIPYQYVKEPQKDFETTLETTGFTIKYSTTEERSYRFSEEEDFEKFVCSLSPYMTQLPEDLRDEFRFDFLAEFKKLNSIETEPVADPTMNSQDLRKALEWELSLDSRDLRSHAWYHGAIPRARAEDIVREEGGFLVRDCTSQPGNYVLTCRTKTQPLHFVINKIILQPDTVYEHVQFQFEEDAFDTVPDLITFYVGSGKAITAASAARIQFPKNRMYPLSFYAAKYPTPLPQSRSPSTPSIQFRMGIGGRGGPPRVPSKKQRSQSLTPSEVTRISQEKCNSADGVIQSSPLMTRSDNALKFSTHSLPRTPNHPRLALSTTSSTLGRSSRLTSDSSLSPCAEKKLFFNESDSGIAAAESPPPPPKPSRVPSIIRLEAKELDDTRPPADHFLTHGGTIQRVASYHTSGSDSGNGSGDSALSSAAGDPIEPPPRNSGVIIKNPRYHLSASDSSTTLKNFEIDCSEAEERLLAIELPQFDDSSFDLDNFHTLLLPVNENKPLDTQALRGIKIMLQESGPRILANHLTKTDLDLIFFSDKNIKYGNGIELCALPHGHQFRLDLIERTECIKLLVAVTILTCSDEQERTEVLNKWIEIAIDIKTALGNLFGFCGIMLGLCLPQVERLDSTWHMLRQKYTDSAFNFEAKLRPTLKNMNSCSNPQAPNTTIPHLLPLVLLFERNFDDFLNPSAEQQSHLTSTCLGLWESNTQDFGLTTLLNHLETARKYLASSASYKRNAEIVLGEARMEELTIDMFRTEFQMKFLWGSRGAFVPATERHSKFEQILTAIAEKYCNLRDDDVQV